MLYSVELTNQVKLKISYVKHKVVITTVFLLGDPCRIQTCNLLIRSQMLYSVELTDQAFAQRSAVVVSLLRVQSYYIFSSLPNFSVIFFRKNSAFLALCAVMT